MQTPHSGESSPKRRPQIILGIKLASDNHWLVRTASVIAVASRARLLLVNVMETDKVTNELGRMVMVAREHLDKDMASIGRELEALKDLCAPETEPETLVLRGNDAAYLLTLRELYQNVNMVIVGCESHVYRWIPQGLSVVMGLIHHPFVPVLVVHKDFQYDASVAAVRVLIADDLTPGFESVLATTIRLIAPLSKPRVLHLHVAEATEHGGVSPFTPLDDERPLSGVECVTRWNAKCDEMRTRLEERWARVVKAADRSLTAFEYRADVRTDQPMHGVKAAEEGFQADLLVVGRKIKSQNSPKIYERVSLHKLLDSCGAMLVVPYDPVLPQIPAAQF